MALSAPFGMASAAGFALIEQNASGLGSAYAGEAARAEDASAIFYNPAGMARLPDAQVAVSGSLVSPHAEFEGSVSPAIGGGNGGDAGSLALIPTAYYARRVAADWWAGVGLYAPFGLKIEYDANWMGRTHAIESDLKTMSVAPAIAWRASPTLSLGGTLSLQRAEATLTNFAGAAGVSSLEGDSWGWGYSLGALWEPIAGTRVGASYRSETDQKLEGDVSFSVAPTVIPASAKVTLPDSLSLSAAHRIGERWTLLADATWTGWSDFEELRVVNAAGATVALTPENWSDAWRYSLGASYELSAKTTLRAGVAYDQTPVSDEFRTARIPDEDRTWLAVGAKFRLGESSAIDVGYAHLFVSDASLSKVEGPIALTGEYESSVDLLSAQFTYSWR